MDQKQYIVLFLPFFCFLLTYQLLIFFFGAQPVSMPWLIGKTISESVTQLSKLDVNIRTLPSYMLSRSQEAIPPDVVIAQIPAAGTIIKQGHTVFITIAQKPQRLCAPLYTGLIDQDILNKAQQAGIKIKLYYITSSQPSGVCIAQLPAYGQELHDNAMIVYISAPQNPIVLFPNLKGQKLGAVQEFLQEYAITYQLHTKNKQLEHSCSECVIYDQKPMPGILVNSQKALTVHIYIEHDKTLPLETIS